MSEGNKIVQLRVSENLLDLMQVEVRRHNAVTRLEQTTLSGWIRDAIHQKIDHLRRGRKGEKVRKYKCVHCGMRRRIDEIDNVMKPMWGKKEYTCVYCVRVTLNPALLPPSNDQRMPQCVPNSITVEPRGIPGTTEG